jgi:hypothetical protein
MKKRSLIILPLALMTLTSCSTINQLNCLIYQSTDAINANREAVDDSTEVIRQNGALIRESTRALNENRRNLEAATKG